MSNVLKKVVSLHHQTNKNSSYMETKINNELASSAQLLKSQLRSYHNLLIEKYTLDGRTYEGAIHRLYKYLDVIDQLDDLLAKPNPWPLI